MNIVLAGQTYGPVNGPGAFTAALARGLAARGDRVTVVVPGRALRSTTRSDGGVAIVELRAVAIAARYPDVRLAVAPGGLVRRILDAVGPDAVHLQDHFPLSRALARAAAARGIPLIATSHFVPENIVPHVPVLARCRPGRRVLHAVLWRMVARGFAPAAAVTTPTPTAATRLGPHLGRPVRAISCGVELARFAAPAGDRAATRCALGLGADQPVVLYVGRLDAEKRVEILIHALAALARRDVALIIAGRGHRAAALARLARALGVADRVRFVGFVAPARLPELLACADYFAMPGDVELQSIATLEAMAAGLPVLAAAAGALPELVTDGVNGALFRANDPAAAAAALATLLAAPAADRRAMSCASRARAARHDLAFTVDAYRALYAELIAWPRCATSSRSAAPERTSR
ncbi:MAG TPA: glycosyltransferase [Kofleriaceae bacterium]|nr:glycosyltransferase [Kofleriaceae bacterium]